jgi:hypothetical protein
MDCAWESFREKFRCPTCGTVQRVQSLRQCGPKTTYRGSGGIATTEPKKTPQEIVLEYLGHHPATIAEMIRDLSTSPHGGCGKICVTRLNETLHELKAAGKIFLGEDFSSYFLRT